MQVIYRKFIAVDLIGQSSRLRINRCQQNDASVADNAYQYNGKELNEDFGLAWLDSTRQWVKGPADESRWYDPAVGRWGAVDNMANKYLSYSPYHYAGNNPILNYDIDGNEFTASSESHIATLLRAIAKSQARLNKKVKRLESELSEDGISSKKMKRIRNRITRAEAIIGEYEGVLSEINVLANSNQVYNVFKASGLGESRSASSSTEIGITSYNRSTGAVDIALSKSSTGLLAHELLHAYQFEIGDISLGERSSRGKPFLLDKTDEVAGYRRQALFGSNEGVTDASSLPERYRKLPEGPVSIHNFSSALTEAIRLKNRGGIQRAANYFNQAFRVNDSTYAPD